MTEKNYVNSVIMFENIDEWILLRWVLILWDKRLKCLSGKKTRYGTRLDHIKIIATHPLFELDTPCFDTLQTRDVKSSSLAKLDALDTEDVVVKKSASQEVVSRHQPSSSNRGAVDPCETPVKRAVDGAKSTPKSSSTPNLGELCCEAKFDYSFHLWTTLSRNI